MLITFSVRTCLGQLGKMQVLSCGFLRYSATMKTFLKCTTIRTTNGHLWRCMLKHTKRQDRYYKSQLYNAFVISDFCNRSLCVIFFTLLHIWSNYKYFDDLTGRSLMDTTSGGKYDIWSPFNGLPWFQCTWNLEAI